MKAFWEDPDWRGGDNLRSRAQPFWMLDPRPDPIASAEWVYNADTMQWFTRDASGQAVVGHRDFNGVTSYDRDWV